MTTPPTPETDLEAIYLHGMRLAPDCKYVEADFARKLERERNRCRVAIESYRKIFNSASARAEECYHRSKAIERERDELQAKLDDIGHTQAMKQIIKRLNAKH